MLLPQDNSYRQFKDLSGIWDFMIESQGTFQDPFTSRWNDYRPIAVPASWNDQFEDLRDFLGIAWYRTYFDLPWGWENKKVFIRFGSVNYLAKVWINGQFIGEHEGGNLPFEFEVTEKLHKSRNQLLVQVDAGLSPARIPSGNLIDKNYQSTYQQYPSSTFDFFPFAGIHRTVLLYATNKNHLTDITVTNEIINNGVKLNLKFTLISDDTVNASIVFEGEGLTINKSIKTSPNSDADILIEIPSPILWSPKKPMLYNLRIRLNSKGETYDEYCLPVGLRTIEVEGNQLLLNKKPIYLRGFGRHEDFPVFGRGEAPPVIIKDFRLMKWVGANSFRTSNYPYSETQMSLADRFGFLIINETPATGLTFEKEEFSNKLKTCLNLTKELILRDKNHPSVIMWSIANEPASNDSPEAAYFFSELYKHVKSIDPSRPVTLASKNGRDERSFEFLDIICLNRFYGWFSHIGNIAKGCEQLSSELDELHHKFQKPIILTEFGADAIPGIHAEPSEMYSEEYQSETIKNCIQVLRSKPFIVGEHVWNFCDYKTGQALNRMGGINYKGIFTRTRQPKLSAHTLREIWRQQDEP